MSTHILEDDLPDLRKLLASSVCTSNGNPTTSLRRSPRKRLPEPQRDAGCFNKLPVSLSASSNQVQNNTAKRSTLKSRQGNANTTEHPQRPTLKNVPSLPKKHNAVPRRNGAISSSSSQHGPQSIKLAHVDSLLLPLSKLAMQEDAHTHASGSVSPPKLDRSSKARQRKIESHQNFKRTKAGTGRMDQFFISEARCSDDDSPDEEGESEDTDLSGFIVDDDAELSYHESSDSDESFTSRKPATKPSRRLQRGSPRRPKSKANNGGDNTEAEVIDLTSSPAKPSETDNTRTDDVCIPLHDGPTGRNLFLDFDKTLRLSPPKQNESSSVTVKAGTPEYDLNFEKHNVKDEHNSSMDPVQQQRFTTPPVTPPASPTKLKSPSKFLSPSKRNDIHRSPHRQSTDAFWDLNTVNDWNDQLSPRKELSPSKGRTRFRIWSDESEDESGSISSDSLPSPCTSPTKPGSPMKSPMKAEMKRLADERKAERARKKAFELSREALANELFASLDRNVTNLKISELASTTGGVQILWSKTLRSTAGRANWKRTVTKQTGSPVKGNTEPTGAIVKHFANIELAEKVIDSEDRLINTLAHEFCHLANFMISNIRDQPHGASFKSWAAKVTEFMKKSEKNPWRKCQVTTKHGYKIDWKYVWVCVGREQNKTMEFLSIEDEGCGAEYGRHSKSINVGRQRCGRCRGMLKQVRPKPRGSPVKREASKASKTTGSSGSEKEIEVIDLSD